jgi:hypothetical protein
MAYATYAEADKAKKKFRKRTIQKPGFWLSPYNIKPHILKLPHKQQAFGVFFRQFPLSALSIMVS